MVALAGEENLKKGEPYRFRTGKQQVEIARRGGIASGEARRRKKTMKDTVKMMLDMQVSGGLKELRAKFAAMGISEEDFTYQTAVIVGVMNQAMKGNTKAAAFLRDTVGENPFTGNGEECEAASLADMIEEAYRDRMEAEDNADEE